MTALLPLAALGLQALWRTLARHGQAAGRRRSSGPQWSCPSSSSRSTRHKPASARLPTPPEYNVVDTHAAPAILAEYPLGYSDIYRCWQRESRPPAAERRAAGHASRLRPAHAPRPDPAGHRPGARPYWASPPSRSTRVRMLTPRFRRAPPPTIPATSSSEDIPDQVDLVPGRRVGLAGGRAACARARHPARRASTKPKPTEGVGPCYRAHFAVRRGRDAIHRAARRASSALVFDADPPQGAAKTLRIADSHGEQQFALAGRTPSRSSLQIPRGVSAAAEDRPAAGLRSGRHLLSHAARRAGIGRGAAACGSRLTRSGFLTLSTERPRPGGRADVRAAGTCRPELP